MYFGSGQKHLGPIGMLDGIQYARPLFLRTTSSGLWLPQKKIQFR
jgi:hypothetical protein